MRAMKTLTRFGLAVSLLALTINASAASPVHPRSFDYYDKNGVEITGIDLNLGRFAHGHFSRRHFMVTQPLSFQYVDQNGVEVTGIDLNLGRFPHHHFRRRDFG